MTLSADLTTLLSVALLAFVGWRSHWTGRLIGLLLLSPGLRYGMALFGFPIRLQLSAWAGDLLRLAGMDVRSEGNVLIRNGIEMAVDPACMGLQMTGVSLVVALFLLIWQERQRHRIVPLGWIMAYGLTAFGLTVVCNLFRIGLLVTFGAMPGTPAHELIGLACVVVYAWLPGWALADWLVRWRGTEALSTRTWPLAGSVRPVVGGAGLLLAGLGLMAFAVRPSLTDVPINPVILRTLSGADNAGFQQKKLANGILMLSTPGRLVYLKPQADWFSSDHSPMVCWRGSGYELRRVRETVLNGHPAYIGELHKRGQVLHTAWWFTNGRTTTISQLSLRGRMLRGETGFVLVNVTTASRP